MSTRRTKYNSIIIVGILFIIWGILGLMDAKNYTYSGYNTDDNWTVINIEEGSPAELAGLQIGDVLKKTGGIAVTDSKALNKRERTKIGETREFIVDRNGEEIALQLTYSNLPDKDKNNNIVGFVIGLLFIVLGIWTLLKHKTELSFAFAVFSICFGFLFSDGPYIASSILGDIVGVISTGIFLFSFTALAIYMLKYPPESSFLKSKNRKLLYIPMLVLIAIIAVLELLKPDGSGTLNMVMRLLFGVFIIAYFLIAIITLFKKYSRISSEKRQETGLNLMLIGALIGIVPILIYFTIFTLSPSTQLPGYDYVFYTFAAMPIFFTLAINKLHNANID